MSLRLESGFEHLREAMAQVLAKEVEFPTGILVTVLGAKVTANTAHASFKLSVFPINRQKEALETLKEYDHEIKEGLAEHLRMRRVPRLHYKFDEMTAHAADIEETIHQLEEKGEISGD